jgi:DNA repair protein RadC
MKKLAFILSEIELRYNPKVPSIQKPQITSAEDAYEQLLHLLDPSQLTIREEAAVLFMNRSNRVVGGYKLSMGGITGTVIDIRIILGIALKCLATGIILCHTHPSGVLKPSESDLRITRRLNEAAQLMEIMLLDHLIITSGGFLSFLEEGILVEPG